MTKVVLYELNEVPWQIIDLYIARRPDSTLAGVLSRSRCQTTHNGDSAHLSPWRTWPTFHTGLYADEHNSFELGQDPDTFRGVTIWDVAENEGLRIGLFGPLQSWPPREPVHGGFYVPDTFARTPATVPASLERFQQFNLSMTNELGFSPDAPVGPGRMIGAGWDMVRRGLSPWSTVKLARQLLRERKDERFKAARSVMQALPAFDLFWRLHTKTDPHLSIFFTNHVAGMMHRFWGDTVPGYSAEHGYSTDEVFGSFVVEAMDIFDHQLSVLVKHVDSQPDTVLIIAASMGQGGIPYEHIGETYVVEDIVRLAMALELGPVQKGLAMYPMNAMDFATDAAAAHAGVVLPLVELNGEPLISDVRVEGSSVSFRVRLEFDGEELSRNILYRTAAGTPAIAAQIEDLGISTAERMGGGNTAYHIPDGIYITYGPGIDPDPSRAVFDVREAGADVLGHLGLADAWASARGVSSA
ncbi:MAG: hypothetical protein JWP31_1164 [Aeromicrobium sp.]|nr:hypothetical protein [Aeromicrobium sp.]